MIGLTIFKSIYTIKHRNIVFCFASVLVVGLNLNVKYVCVPGWEFVISIVKQNDLIEWLHTVRSPLDVFLIIMMRKSYNNSSAL